MKIIDALGIGLIVLGIVMTAVCFFVMHGPAADVMDFKIQEIPGTRV